MQTANDKDNKRDRESFEEDKGVDNVSPPPKRQKSELELVEKYASDQQINLIELFLQQDDRFLFFPIKTAHVFTVLSRYLSKRYLELTEKYKVLKLTFNLDLMTDLGYFNERAKSTTIHREKVYITLGTPQLDSEKYDTNRKKIAVPAPRIYLSEKWKNINIHCNISHLWQTDIKTIEIYHGGEINVLKIDNDLKDCSPEIQKYGESIGLYLTGIKKINIMKRNILQKVSFHDAACTKDAKYHYFQNYYYNKEISLGNDRDKVTSLVLHGDNDHYTDWDGVIPSETFPNLKYLEMQAVEAIVEFQSPSSLKSIKLRKGFSGAYVLGLCQSGTIFDSIEMDTIDYVTLGKFLSICTTKKLVIRNGFRVFWYSGPPDHKVTLPKTLESCYFGDYDSSDEIPYENPFLDFSLTDMKFLRVEMNAILTLPFRCVHLCLMLGDDPNFFEDRMPDHEIVKEWIWPMNMESLEMNSVTCFNYNPHVPDSLKYITFMEMEEKPDFPDTLSNVTLKATIADYHPIDFKLFPNIFISIVIDVENADIFQKIGHLHDLEELSVRIIEPIEERIDFQCPQNLRNLRIRVPKKSCAEIHIVPNGVLGRVVYKNIDVIIDRTLYQGIFYEE